MSSAACVVVAATPGMALGVNRYYLGPSGGGWNTAASWNTVEAGGGATGVPVAGDHALIRGSPGKNLIFNLDYNSLNALLQVSVDSTSTVTNTLSQSGNLLTAGTTVVGDLGLGLYVQSGGTHTLTSALRVGAGAAGGGRYSLSGTGNLSSGDATVGWFGGGTFIQTGGTHNADTLIVGDNSGSSGFYQITGASSSLTVSGATTVGNVGDGAFTQSSGTFSTAGLTVGFSSGSGLYTLAGGTLNNTGQEAIGSFGTGTFTQSGGTHTISGGLTIGSNAIASGRYVLSAGTLSTNSLTVALGGAGTFSQSASTSASVTGSLNVAQNPGASGELNVGSLSTLTIGTAMNVGGGNIAGGAGTVNLSGSALMNVASTLRIWDSPGTAFNFPSGRLTVSSLDTNGNPARFNWTGGTLTVTGGSGLSISPTGALGSAPVIELGQSLVVNSAVNVGSGSVLNLAGGTVTVGSLDLGSTPTRLNWNGGTINITTAVTLGTGSALGTSLSVDAGEAFNASSSLAVASNAVLLVRDGLVTSGASLSNNGEIQLDGALSQISGGQLTNNKLVTGDGRINATLFNSFGLGEVRVSGTDRLVFTSATNTNNGKINLVNGGTAEFNALTNTGLGRIAGEGTLIVSAGVVNNGQMVFSGDFSEVLGAVTNSNDILITGGSTTTFYDAVTNNAGGDINVAANSAVVFLQPVTGAGTISGSGTKFFADGSSSMAVLATPGSSVVQAPAVVTTGHVRESALDVSGLVIVSPNGGDAGVSFLGSLLITDEGEVDLNDNDLVVNSGDFTQILGWVLAGFGPSGPRITSGTSKGAEILALFDNALVGVSEWAGRSIAPEAVVGKYTYFGDANFDGQVTGDDYTVIDANLNTTPAEGLGWLSGDMNLDGTITGDDYTVIDANLGLGAGNPLVQSALGVVPEPGGIMVFALFAGMRRRKRRWAPTERSEKTQVRERAIKRQVGRR